MNSSTQNRLKRIQQILSNEHEDLNVKITVLKGALKYGQPGLDVVSQVVKTGTGKIKKIAFDLLLERLAQEKQRIEREILELTTQYFSVGSVTEAKNNTLMQTNKKSAKFIDSKKVEVEEVVRKQEESVQVKPDLQEILK